MVLRCNTELLLLGYIDIRLIETARFILMNIWFSKQTSINKLLFFSTKKKTTKWILWIFKTIDKTFHKWYEEQSKLMIIKRVDQSQKNGYSTNLYIAVLSKVWFLSIHQEKFFSKTMLKFMCLMGCKSGLKGIKSKHSSLFTFYIEHV